MGLAISWRIVIRGLILTIVCLMGRTGSCAPLCTTPLASLNLTISAVGIEKEGNWALVSFDGKDATLVQQGETLRNCYKVSQVTHNSVLLADITTTTTREFFLAGHASKPTGPSLSHNQTAKQKPASSGSAILKPLSPHVSAVEYPPSFDADSYPRAILTTKQDDKIFDDYSVIGLDPTTPDGTSNTPSSAKEIGVQVGKISQDSFFGAVGLQGSHRIISINGKRVSSKRDISRVLRDVGSGEVDITYYDAAEDGLLTTHAAIKSSK